MLSDQNKLSQTRRYELEVAPPSEKSENSLNPLQSPILHRDRQGDATNQGSGERPSILKIDDQKLSIVQSRNKKAESRT